MTPDKHTNSEQFLDVGNGHQIYVQDWGNKKAKVPVMVLHGGPGSGSKDHYRNPFDPEKQRVIFFDQRGSGKSLPKGELKHNTTKDVIADMVQILDTLKIKKVILKGGSWGATLALAFAIAHPKRTHALVIDGVFTGSKEETDWFEKGGWRTFYPDVWDEFVASAPKSHQDDPAHYHYERIMGDDEAAAKASGLAYETFEGRLLSMNDKSYTPTDLADYDLSASKIEMHYLYNLCFMPDNYILDNLHKLTMPVYMIQGRFDNVCPPTTAYKISKQAPNAHLYLTIASHKAEHETLSLQKMILDQLTS